VCVCVCVFASSLCVFPLTTQVRLVGVCMERTPWLVLLEVMQYGDLKAMLVACTQRNIFVKPGELWFYGRQLSEGMAFMISKVCVCVCVCVCVRVCVCVCVYGIHD
jgi:hypothetical protein